MHIAVFNYESLTPSEGACFLQMGAMSFLKFREENNVIIKSLQMVLSGKPSISQDIEQADIQYRLNVPDNVRFSPKEHDAFRFLALGNSAAITAEKMGITRETVCNYRQSIYHKLGIHSQDEILVHAIRLGIVGLDEISPIIACYRKEIEAQNKKHTGGIAI
jgi:DNA-binding CsgD family transcriptional regulator